MIEKHCNIEGYLSSMYDIGDVLHLERNLIGRGLNYFVRTTKGKYFLKIVSKHDISVNLENEVNACQVLNKAGIKTSQFVRNLSYNYVSHMPDDKLCHLQLYVNGKTWGNNSAPDWLMMQGAELLSCVHVALEKENYPLTYKFNTINDKEKHIEKLEHLSSIAYNISRTQNQEIINQLKMKMDTIAKQPNFNMNDFYLGNTHCDFSVIQMITSQENIEAVIDFSEVAKAPVFWELIRFYAHSASEVEKSAFKTPMFQELINKYTCLMNIEPNEAYRCFELYIAGLAQSDYGYKEYLLAQDVRYLHHAEVRVSILDYLNRNMEAVLTNLKFYHGGNI